MWCTVHVLYRNGIRLPADAAQASGVVGWLYMNSNNPGQGEPLRQAFLLPNKDVPLTRAILEPLKYCALRSIMGGGIRLVGQQPSLTPNGAPFHQSWWVIPRAAP